MTVSSVGGTAVQEGAPHPTRSAAACQGRRKQGLGDAVGLNQFGVNRVELDPGVVSTVRHWHSHEDEFVLVLEGDVTLVTDAGETLLRSGDMAGFKAGVPDAHRLENRSDRLAVYLEVGSRRPEVDIASYPDDGLECRPAPDGGRIFTGPGGRPLDGDA